LSCEFSPTAVQGYFDGELDALRAADFERHIETCGECHLALEQLDTMRGRFQQADLYEHASPQLRQQVRAQLGMTDDFRRTPTSGRRLRLLIPAFAILGVAVAFAVSVLLLQPRADTARFTAELIDAHVRSLQPGHLTDVQSTDQHTVKPWFDGKLAFIPPVSDYSAQGFPLLGGRLDAVNESSVAALVYGRRKHIINLFVWPAQGRSIPGNSGSRQGYNWVLWRSGEMQFCLISDVSPDDLRVLKDLLSR
jgi:anti-sigma factor RsiW